MHFTQNIISNAEKSNSIIASKSFKFYPNPVKDELYIECADKNIFSLTNQAGKILFTKTINGKAEINVTNLAAGFYYLKNNTTGETQKVVVIK